MSVEQRRSTVIRRLVIGQIVTLTIALSAGYLALRADQNRIVVLQTSRIQSRRDSCRLIKGLALRAATEKTRPAVFAYIDGTPLKNCNYYAHTDLK